MNDIMSLKRTRRSYSAEFKTELVNASQQPGVSLAALALHHGLNANLLRCWVREQEREGKSIVTQTDTTMLFVPVCYSGYCDDPYRPSLAGSSPCVRLVGTSPKIRI